MVQAAKTYEIGELGLEIRAVRSVFLVTQTDPRSSLMMADYCLNM
jgi:hypothetical protein